MWKLRIGIFVTSGLLAAVAGGTASARTGGPNAGEVWLQNADQPPGFWVDCGSPAPTPATSISAITVSRPRHHKAKAIAEHRGKKKHKKKVIRHERRQKREVKATTLTREPSFTA